MLFLSPLYAGLCLDVKISCSVWYEVYDQVIQLRKQLYERPYTYVWEINVVVPLDFHKRRDTLVPPEKHF